MQNWKQNWPIWPTDLVLKTRKPKRFHMNVFIMENPFFLSETRNLSFTMRLPTPYLYMYIFKDEYTLLWLFSKSELWIENCTWIYNHGNYFHYNLKGAYFIIKFKSPFKSVFKCIRIYIYNIYIYISIYLYLYICIYIVCIGVSYIQRWSVTNPESSM